MNKKFSTLMASLLLAGGMVTPAFADTFDQVKDKCEGRFYHVYVNGSGQDATTASGKLTLSETNLWTLDATKADLWSILPKKEGGKVVGYQLKNRAGKILTVTKKNADNSTTIYDTFADDDVAMWFNVDGVNDAGFCGKLNDVTSQPGEVWRYNFQEVQLAEAMSVEEVNAFLGKDKGFKLSIGYLKDNKVDKFTAYELEGNVFAGTLKAVGDAEDKTYALKNADGKNLVLTNRDWNEQNTKIGQKFTLMTDQELKDQQERDAEGGLDHSNPVILTTEFQISKNEYNGYLEVVAVAGEGDDEERYELLVSGYNNKYYLTVNKEDNKVELEPDFNNNINRTYVKFGGDNLVDMTKFAAKVYYSFIDKDGKVAGANCDTNESPEFTTFFQKEAQANMPEGQWLLSNVNVKEGKATFYNRESKQTFVISLNSFYYADKAKNLYEIAGVNYTIKTVAMSEADKGYADFEDTTLKTFTIGLYSPVWGGVANLVENHASETHQIGLDTEDATVWNLEPNAAAAKYNKNTGVKTAATDSVYVINNYTLWNANTKKYDTKPDTLKIVSYMIKNVENGEYIAFNDDKDFYTCDKSKDKAEAQAFAFKKVGDSYNMVEVDLGTELTDDAEIDGGKVYGGDSANKGLLNNVDCIYDRTENDLFKVDDANIALYRRIKNGMDTISIYRADNKSELLYEQNTFLGWANDNQFEFAPAMLADTAYVEEDAIRPQYMLVVGKPITVVKGTQELCPVCGLPDCEHSDATYDTVEGRYLVNLKDSAIAFDNKNIHAVNPYVNTEKYYRLGFVEAKRVNKTLTIASTGKKLNIGTPDYNEAKFAFKYVDEAEGTFRIETADFARETGDGVDRGTMLSTPGYVKTMNGVIVVVSNEIDGDIFNMNEDENRTPTANEGIETAGVKVIAADGAVIVKGAAGKNVVISNVLGQTIANTVVASDEAQIAVPAGVVVVAVEGEAAVKAIVK